MPGTGATPEWSLLLAACSAIPPKAKTDRIRELLRGPVEWKSLFELADRHGTQPLLYAALSDIADEVPPEPMHSLQQSCQSNTVKALLVSRELIRIVERLTELGIDVMPYKGPALAEVVYADIALRKSGDIDLLIRPQDLGRVRDAVGQLGYRPHLHLSAAEGRAYLKSGYELAFDGAAGPNLLEVQWAIQPRFYAIDFDMAGIFRRGVTVPVAGRSMKTPSLEDLFLILLVHAAKHVWARLVWLCDLARLMSMPTLDWNWIAQEASELGIVRVLQVTMALANRLLGAAIPQLALEIFPADSESAAITEGILKQYPGDADVESLAYFRLMARLRERRADQMRLAWRLIVTPGLSEWRSVRLPAPLFPLYRLVRLSRLAARLARP